MDQPGLQHTRSPSASAFLGIPPYPAKYTILSGKYAAETSSGVGLKVHRIQSLDMGVECGKG